MHGLRLILLTAFGILLVFALLTTPGPSGAERFIIAPESSLKQISAMLASEHLIRSSALFQVVAVASGNHRHLKAGAYAFPAPVSVVTLLRTLANGPNEPVIRFRILDGARIDEIIKSLEQTKLASAKAILELVRNPPSTWAQQWPWLALRASDQGLEGFLLPDTYFLTSSMTAETIVSRFLDNFDRSVVQKLSLAQRSSPAFYDRIILASILEKEIDEPLDRRKVADLFLRRLKQGLPLQADSTVNYITGKQRLQVTLEETLIASPFNTYRNRGLPPSPINNPSIAAIHAAFSPLPHTALYFLTTPEGNVMYSQTFREHVAAKRKYLSKPATP